MQPFRIDVAQAEIEDLRERLHRTRWAAPHEPTGWDRGVPQDVLRELADHWADGYDWRAHEQRLNDVEQYRTVIDGTPIHVMHRRSADPDATALLLSHGWPGSVVEFRELLGPLTEPGPGACHTIVPALPGYGWSSPLSSTGWTVDRIADAWLELMTRLGYERFAVQGGDWGAYVSRQIAVRAPHRVLGTHLNMHAGGWPRDLDAATLTDRERAHLARLEWFRREGRGYNVLQSTRPDTVAYALTDSPVGQLAWIAEKFHDWTDPASEIDRDTLLTNVSIYWFTRTAGSSAQLYWETRHLGMEPGRNTTPTAMAVFAHDLAPSIRRAAEQGNTIVRWNEFDAGGHFAALEQPEVLARDVREFVAGLDR